jgi:hypothetical protein
MTEAQPRLEEDEPRAWSQVEARWADPAAHRAYLDGCTDLDALAVAGRRYRAVLEARPGDAVALGMKAEILKRATVVGLAMLPRTPPPALAGGPWKRRLLLLLASSLASAGAWFLWKVLNG